MFFLHLESFVHIYRTYSVLEMSQISDSIPYSLYTCNNLSRNPHIGTAKPFNRQKARGTEECPPIRMDSETDVLFHMND